MDPAYERYFARPSSQARQVLHNDSSAPVRPAVASKPPSALSIEDIIARTRRINDATRIGGPVARSIAPASTVAPIEVIKRRRDDDAPMRIHSDIQQRDDRDALPVRGDRHRTRYNDDSEPSAASPVHSKRPRTVDAASAHIVASFRGESPPVTAASSTAAVEPEPDPPASPVRPEPSAVSIHVPLWHGCRSVACYRPLHKIDEGVYGVVFAAEEIATGARFALKKVKMSVGDAKEGFPITALRESNVLLSLRHPNIIAVKEMVVGASMDAVYMVMEFMDHDVKALMGHMRVSFSQSELKCLMHQLLSGCAAMHAAWVVHRDLKTSNLLMNHAGRLCIADFGLARRYASPPVAYTHSVVTLWYRAPELLLLGADTPSHRSVYGTGVDMWSVGCIFAELLTKKPLMPGKTEGEQLDLIFNLCGTPTEESWPEWSQLPAVKGMRVRPRQPAPLRHALGLGLTGYGGAPFLSEAGLDLMRSLLALNPAHRITQRMRWSTRGSMNPRRLLTRA